MSFGGKSDIKPDKNPRPAGILDEQLSSNEEGRIVPVFWGQQRLPGVFISKVFNVKAVTKKQEGGKFQPDATIGTDYYASWAVAFCMGVCDALIEIWLDGKSVWSGSLQQVSQDFDDITIEGRGVMRLYWGTETQDADPHLNDAEASPQHSPSEQDHPAYIGVCYAVFKRFYLGRDRSQLPNVELTLRKYPEEYPWISSSEAKVSSDVNVPAAAYDLLVNTRYGLGLPTARFDETGIDAVLDALNDEDVGCSPVLTSGVTAREVVQQMLEYVDAYALVGVDGKLSIGLVRQNTPTPELGIDQSDLVEVPKFDPGSWIRARNQTRVNFRDRDRSYKEAITTWRDQGTHTIVGEPSVQSVARPWVTRRTVALHLAGAIGAVSAVPQQVFTLEVLKSSVPINAVGRIIPFTYPALGLAAVPLRVLSQSIGDPKSHTCTLECRRETSWLNSPHYGSTDDPANNEADAEAQAAANQIIVELPYDLCLPSQGGGRDAYPRPSLAALLVRTDVFTNRYQIWKKRSPTSATFVKVATDDAFAIHGTLTAQYSADTDTIDSRYGFTVDIDSPDSIEDFEPQDLEDAIGNSLLIFIGNEILSLYKFELVTGTTFKVFPVRGRYDTVKATHANGAEVWIVPRTIITPFDHPGILNNKSATYRLLTEIEDSVLPIAAASDVSKTFNVRCRRPVPPQNIRKTATANDRLGAMNLGTYSSGQNIFLRWDLTDQRGDDFWSQWRSLSAKNWINADDYQVHDECIHTTANYVFVAIQESGPNLGGAVEPFITAGWQSYWVIKPSLLQGTLIEFYTPALVLKKTILLGAGVRKFKLTASQVNTWYGSLSDIHLRAYGRINQLTSVDYTTYNLIKI